MKKSAIIIVLLTFVFILPGAFAEDSGRMKDRTIEIGLANLDVGFANSFISMKDIFKKHVVIDLDDLKDGFKLNMNAAVEPLYFSYNKDDKWGFGLHVGIDAYGIIDLAGEMLTFQQARKAESDLTAAVFADVSIPIFFRIPVPVIDKLKIKVEPSLYYPVLYAKPDISYTYQTRNGETYLDFNLAARVYSAGPFFDEENGGFDLTATPGLDWAIGAEFALSDALGLGSVPLLDFDVGVDLTGIPMIAARMTDYMEAVLRVGGNEPIDLMSEEGIGDDFVSDEDPTYGKDKISIYRPFKALAWVNWRPFTTEVFTVIPTVGFSVNQMYKEKGSFEGGLKACFDLNNTFIATLGVGYYDRLWKNSIDLALNLRAFEFDIGARLQGPTFADSWEGSGFGLAFGLKFGW